MPSDFLAGPVMLRITSLADGCWHLIETELGHTIATFTSQGDAFDYARDLLERGKQVIILVDGSGPAVGTLH